ncbi:MAG: synthase [Glaciihabitans sp.]|nr:synthase [Glaciihabitans sp.]
MSMPDVSILTGGLGRSAIPPVRPAAWSIRHADAGQLAAYRRLRRDVFVAEQGLFSGNDSDRVDDDPRTIVLVAVTLDGTVVGGVRLAPATEDRDIGWWNGSRLVVDVSARSSGGIGAELVRSACTEALSRGVLRFEATVQTQNETMFRRLGWQRWGSTVINGLDHVRMRYPIDRIANLVASTKAQLEALLDPYGAWGASSSATLGGNGFVGDDGAPVPGTDVIAACDSILPALIERDPEWAGWCAVLVNLNDLAAMGATPVGMLDALGARTLSSARRVMNGIRSGSDAWQVPILGGHTQLGVSPSLSITALGRALTPVRGGGGRLGHTLSLTADLSGQWRRGFEGRQWDSSSSRSGLELRTLGGIVGSAAPAAAKDVSMAGVVGTVGMLAEASGYGAVLDVVRIPTPDVPMGDWLTCFPGFGMISADLAGASRMDSPLTSTAECGELTMARGVRLRWPDGETTEAVSGTVTGLGRA